MARTPKHGATVHTRETCDGEIIFRVIKIIEGRTDYAMETLHAVNAYECATDMARGNGKAIVVKPKVAKVFRERSVTIDDEWTVTNNTLV